MDIFESILKERQNKLREETTDASIETMVSMLKEILSYQPQEDVDIDWLLDNTNMGDVQIINDIIGHFLGVSAQEEK